MSNELTGDFDAVMEFSLDAVNRVMASMHQAGTGTPAPPASFPHSLTLRVDDNPPSGTRTRAVSAYGASDSTGRAVSNLNRATDLFSQSGATDAVFHDPSATLGSGGDATHAGALSFTHLRGIAQVQLGAPTLTIPDDSGSRVTAHLPIRARYVAEPDTVPMPEYLKGELQLGVDVKQVGTNAGAAIDFDLSGTGTTATVRVDTASEFVTSEEKDIINQFVTNTVRTSFRRSGATAPAGPLKRIEFKTIRTPEPVVAALVQLTEGGAADPRSATNVFKQRGEDFAAAVSSDFILGQLNAAIPQNLSFTLTASVTIVFTFSAQYDVTASIAIELQEGRILVTVVGSGHTSSIAPDFDFQGTQALKLRVESGAIVLEKDGDVSVTVNIHGPLGVFNESVADRAKPSVQSRCDALVNTAGPAINQMLALDLYIESFLRSLNVRADLVYGSIETHPAGLIIRGSFGVDPYGPAQVEFDSRRAYRGNGTAYAEYTALTSWIPGGQIDSFIWRRAERSTPILTDRDAFVYPRLQTGGHVGFDEALSGLLGGIVPAIAGPEGEGHVSLFGPKGMCLTVTGTRLTPKGPVASERIEATWCQVVSIPLVVPPDAPRFPERTPVALLTPIEDGPARRAVVSGYLIPSAPPGLLGVGSSMNLLVRFSDGDEASLAALIEAVAAARREDAPVAILAIVPTDRLAEVAARFPELLVTDDPEGGWTRRFDVQARPSTCIVDPYGKVRFRHTGALDAGRLIEALREQLLTGAEFRPTLVQTRVNAGSPPPDFVFEQAPGFFTTLSKLQGRPVLVVFWTSWAAPSLRLLHDLASRSKPGGYEPLTVLAINDGEAKDVAERAFRALDVTAQLVLDPDRAISIGYGISCWPTTISIDADGRVSAIWLGVPTDWLSEAGGPAGVGEGPADQGARKRLTR
jgi:thiol-disulfide isomerase/thioredoxin